jgi:epoxyqueuosine reductase
MKILLHICCGVCSTSVIERLLCEGHTVTGFFYNPNIHPVDEYKKRLEAAQKAAREWNIELIEGKYDRQIWFECVKGEEHSPEGGSRCGICYRLRLKRTYEYMKKHMFDAFTTTLTVSPMKNVVEVNLAGRDIGGEKFICSDFKKKGGFQRAIELSGEWGLYRQNYCGCVYSQEEEIKRRERKSSSEKKDIQDQFS